ncbi:MAG: esterase family protein [Bacteroidetes bacterium]|nr:MAG: esterase family protein [Bacteroidota bacterium]
MQKPVNCLVVKPNNYTGSGDPLPVVYLLHGYSGDHSSWLKDAPQLLRKADQFQMLFVLPDGGYDSWYLDSPVDSTVRYETFVVREVVPFIDQHYATVADRSGRAIAGLSMGGHGAVYLAARNPDVFGAAGSMAGGLDLRPFRKNNWDLEGVLGKPDRHWKNWEAHSVVNLLHNLKDKKVSLIIDCGTDDFFLDANRLMHKRLLKANIPHTYTERPGGHSGDYWGNAVDFQLVFFDKFFKGS